MGVVDDCALFREGVVLALAASDGIELVDQGGTIGEALRIAYEKRPDLVLLSINTPDPEFAAVTALCSVSPKTKVIVLLLSASEDAVRTALKAGARAYILKSVSGSELVKALRSIHEDEAIATVGLAKSGGVPAPRLTRREQQIFDRVARGESNKEIGQALQITEKTVKQHNTRMFQKLKVRNRVGAALLVHNSIDDE